MKIVDIGAGGRKIPGSIGIDNSESVDVDIKIDLNVDDIPLDDNSVDYVHASHSLEHLTLEGFWHIMREIYRILKPGAQLYVGAPYFFNSGNLANPFHDNRVCFNEHTFRFFSSAGSTTALPATDYAKQFSMDWGLRYSANCEIGMEFELVYINFLYFDKYKNESEEARRVARNTQLNVVNYISYVMKAVKPCPTLSFPRSTDAIRSEIGQIEQKRKEIFDFIQDRKPMLTPAQYDKAQQVYATIPVLCRDSLYCLDEILLPSFETMHLHLLPKIHEIYSIVLDPLP